MRWGDTRDTGFEVGRFLEQRIDSRKRYLRKHWSRTRVLRNCKGQVFTGSVGRPSVRNPSPLCAPRSLGRIRAVRVLSERMVCRVTSGELRTRVTSWPSQAPPRTTSTPGTVSVVISRSDIVCDSPFLSRTVFFSVLSFTGVCAVERKRFHDVVCALTVRPLSLDHHPYLTILHGRKPWSFKWWS